MLEKPNLSLSAAIVNKAIKQYGQVAKPLQLKTVVNLARDCNVMLLAGTGFGKS
jgi:Lhr-like helicase